MRARWKLGQLLAMVERRQGVRTLSRTETKFMAFDRAKAAKAAVARASPAGKRRPRSKLTARWRRPWRWAKRAKLKLELSDPQARRLSLAEFNGALATAQAALDRAAAAKRAICSCCTLKRKAPAPIVSAPMRRSTSVVNAVSISLGVLALSAPVAGQIELGRGQGKLPFDRWMRTNERAVFRPSCSRAILLVPVPVRRRYWFSEVRIC
jgi:hypothetical protein